MIATSVTASINVRLFINGAWRNGSTDAVGDVIDPSTGRNIGHVAHARADDVAEAIRAAGEAFVRWSRTEPERIAAILTRAADLIVERMETMAVSLTREQGKTLAESRGELARAIETLRWHAAAASRARDPQRHVVHAYAGRDSGMAAAHAARSDAAFDSDAGTGTGTGADVRPEPIGVVGAFIPWNYPAVIAARKLSAALVAGCTVVLKGAEETPTIVALIVAALEDAGLPPGVVNLLFGDPPAISAQVLDSPIIQAFSFTGSTVVGKQLAERAGRTLKRCVLELGGHAPVLVFADADLDAAIDAIAAYKFECAGQSCNAPSRVYVEASIYDRFVERFADVARALRVGPGLDPSTDMGPMANARRLDAMTRLTADAVSLGARILTGGARLTAATAAGFFWPPTVLVDVPETAAMLIEEPFGPLLPIVPFASFDEAIARANATPYGLAAYVFTQSDRLAADAARALAAGSVGVNELRGVPPDIAIAGIKDSGYGYEGGWPGIDAFLNLKVVRGRV